MSDSEFRPNMVGSNRSQNVYNLSSALAVRLGLPTDVIEQALINVIEENTSINDANALTSSSTNIYNSIQELKPVDKLSQSTALNSPDSNYNVRPSFDIDSNIHKSQESLSQPFKKNRKDSLHSLSSLIEITQNGSTSINVKLPSLLAQPPTVQGELSNNQFSSQNVNTNSFDENFSQPPYYDEQNIYNRSNNESSMQNQIAVHEYIPPPQRDSLVNHVQNTYKPEHQNRQIDSAFEEYIPPQQRNKDIYNQNQQIDSDVPKDFIQQELKANHFQDTYNSFTPEVQNRQINSVPNFSEEYIRKPQTSQQDSYKTFSQVVSPIKNNSSGTYSSEFPSLPETARKGDDSRKNSGVDLGAWGIASAWDKPKKWSSDTESTFDPPVTTSTWNPNDADLSWKPMQEPKSPINKKKPASSNFEMDDSEGWGAPPTNYIPWDDASRQGYCVDLIEEQRETTFWSVQNGTWVNVSEEYSITSEKKTVAYTPDGLNQKNVRKTRTQTQRIERRGLDDGATWDELREGTRLERKERGLISDEATEDTAKSVNVELTDHSNDNSDSSGVENYRYTAEGSRERLGNPKWKNEEEWRNESKPRQFNQEVICGDLINLDTNDISGSKSPEPSSSTTTSDREESGDLFGPNEEISNWDNWGSISNRSTEAITDLEPVKNDAWFADEVEKFTTKNSEQNVLINIDSNYDNVASGTTVINTHPPIFHGRVNSDMAELNDIIFDSTNPANATKNHINNNNNNSNSNLLSFDDDVDNKATNSSDDNNNKNNSFNLDELSVFFGNKPSDVIENSNEQEKPLVLPYTIDEEKPSILPYTIDGKSDNSHYTTSLNDTFGSFAPPSRSYRCENSLQDNIEPTTSSTIDINGKDNEDRNSVNEPQKALEPNSNDPNSNEPNLKTETNGGEFMINLTVETPSDGRQILRLRYDDDPDIAAIEFCRKWNMENFEDALRNFVQKEQKRRLRKRRAKCKK